MGTLHGAFKQSLYPDHDLFFSTQKNLSGRVFQVCRHVISISCVVLKLLHNFNGTEMQKLGYFLKK